MRHIGIIGAGNIGRPLAKRFVALGHTVMVANSRGPESLRQFAQETGARAVGVEEAVASADILIIAVPVRAVHQLRDRLGSALSRVPAVVDTGNYMPLRDGPIAEIEQGQPETAWVAEQLRAPVVKAFNCITAHSLANGGKPKGTLDRIALPVAGDDPKARAIVMDLVDELGFDPFDAGSLAASWRQQSGQPAYCVDASLAELPPLLKRADREKGPINRDKSMAIVAKLPADFPQEVLVRVSRLTTGLDTWKPRSWLAMVHLGTALLRPKG